MNRPRVAVLPGDGIGSEVMSAAVRVLDTVGFEADYVHGDIGWEWWRREGDALPPRTIEVLRSSTCALFGAITSKPEAECERELNPMLRGGGLRYTSPIVRLRQLFELHTAMRPCRAFPGNPLNIRDDIDIVVFRENTEGLYGGIEWNGVPEPLARQMADAATGHPHRMQRWFDAGLGTVALSTRFVSRRGCERIARSAFAFAQANGRRSVTLLEKPNILRATGGLMTTVFREVARAYPGIEAREANIDSACMQLVTNPTRFDVIVAENMFGDIVSDLGAGLVGGLGFAPSANLGDSFALFEPTHGSAPDIAGRGIANPIAMILSSAMMVRWLGASDKAEAIECAVASVIGDGMVDTPDVCGATGRGTTESITNHILDRLTRVTV